MNQLQRVFDYKGQEIRTVMHNNEPWFVAKDVCDILEISNSRHALTRLEDEEKADVVLNDGRQNRSFSIINESGLYELIFASRKLEAKTFKKWVKQEVLPSIRKHGAYMTPEKIEEVLLNPDTIIKIATQLKDEQQKRIEAEQRIKQQQPLVAFAEACMTSDKSLLVREVAKLCSKNGIITGERRLWQKLREWKLVFANKNEPYQEYIDRGYFEIAQGVKGSSKGAFTWLTTRVTPKGQSYIINRLKKELNKKAVI
ncbi:BRO family protein [Lederbergia wuyishanensis]|uniref:Prophage antirepressor-like protein n=1 Tax=Lederbergia wuyishanensis TaxID=1347903 RepID=A0ABU0D7B9_9BACI|nr:phage antirepressor [Lederbergia wuyishanensis]MCJ8008938.1 phage antirepressor [Lederbergia wuyishanensis]MDQ0344265.1 prophage antirepressor-like protein [Lederbergia wuyishanensis]